jgi:hypothetical protein
MDWLLIFIFIGLFVLGYLVALIRTFASTEGRTCHGLSPEPLLLENTFFVASMELESLAHP